MICNGCRRSCNRRTFCLVRTTRAPPALEEESRRVNSRICFASPRERAFVLHVPHGVRPTTWFRSVMCTACVRLRPHDYRTTHHNSAVLMLIKSHRIVPFVRLGRNWSRRFLQSPGMMCATKGFSRIASHRIAFFFSPEGANLSVDTPLAGYDLRLSSGKRRFDIDVEHALSIA